MYLSPSPSVSFFIPSYVFHPVYYVMILLYNLISHKGESMLAFQVEAKKLVYKLRVTNKGSSIYDII